MHILPTLEYPYETLEPYIDKDTMIIHHTKHHQGYVNNLNDALSESSVLRDIDIQTLLINIKNVPQDIRTKVINNGGGHYNHTLFWKMIGPKRTKPDDKIKKALEATFGGLEEFKEKFSDTALSHFGSGWAWLIVNNNNKLQITNTSNQDSPLMEGHTPLLAIDIWEHAYYLKYQNRKAEYIKAWWNVVNWDYVSETFRNTRLKSD